jgi:hypothetical protein
MPNMTNTLISNITATEDTTQNVIINRSTGASFDGSASAMSEYISLAAGTTPISLATGICTQFYLKNIDPNGHSVIVSWTPTTGASVPNVITLYPGDQIMFWAKPGTSNGGITALSLTPSAATTLIEYFFGG